MTVTTSLTRHDQTYTFAVEGVADMPVPYLTRVMRPREVTVQVVDGAPRYVRAYGPNVKADGSAGLNIHDVSWSAPFRDSPQWVLDLIAEVTA